jgi:hypothetical protein
MHRIKHPHLRNKIDLTDSAQVRAWRRLGQGEAPVTHGLLREAGLSLLPI